MKIRQFISLLLLAVSTMFFNACKDSSLPPITLAYTADGKTLLSDDHTVYLSPFEKEGINLYILGGNGVYSIESNPNTQIADYRFNGKNMISIHPIFDDNSGKVNIGTTNMIISDRGGNTFVLNIVVEYPEKTYTIKKVGTIINGDNLTLKEKNEIESQIIKSNPVKDGGRYVFTYTNKELTEGTVKIYTTANAITPSDGIFKQNKSAIDKEGINIRIDLTGGNFYLLNLNYILTNGDNSEQSDLIFKQNVTETYKGEYPTLKEAYGIQLIPAELN